MKILLQSGRYALIDRGNQLKEIAVVYGLNKENGEWKHTCDYWSYEYNGNPTYNALTVTYAVRKK